MRFIEGQTRSFNEELLVNCVSPCEWGNDIYSLSIQSQYLHHVCFSISWINCSSSLSLKHNGRGEDARERVIKWSSDMLGGGG